MKVREIIKELRSLKNEDHSQGVALGCSEISNALERTADFLRTAAKIADVSSKVLKKPETVVAISKYANTAMKAAATMYIEVLQGSEEEIDSLVFEINENETKVNEAKERLYRMKQQAHVNAGLKEDEEDGIEYDEEELESRIQELKEEYDEYYAA